MDASEERFIERAVELARLAESEGNLPIGAVIALDGEIVAEGRSHLLEPVYDPGRHAEIDAIDGVEPQLWPRAEEMTCYTTLEPCVMCTGTLLLHGVGRVVFGARDERGGGGSILEALPPIYQQCDPLAWEGPVLPEVCDPLYERASEMFEELPAAPGPSPTADAGGAESEIDRLRDELDAWLEGETERSVQQARRSVQRLAEVLGEEDLEVVFPYAAEVFRRGGYLKDYRNLEEWARRANRIEYLERVESTMRHELPDIWVRRALESGDYHEAVSRWFEVEDLPRARHVADELVELCGDGRPQLVISCRLAKVAHLVGRGGRRRYRKACGILRKLRDELQAARESEFWRHIVDEVRSEHDNRPAFLDEMSKAGFE